MKRNKLINKKDRLKSYQKLLLYVPLQLTRTTRLYVVLYKFDIFVPTYDIYQSKKQISSSRVTFFICEVGENESIYAVALYIVWCFELWCSSHPLTSKNSRSKRAREQKQSVMWCAINLCHKFHAYLWKADLSLRSKKYIL